jgi:hypothetical protein
VRNLAAISAAVRPMAQDFLARLQFTLTALLVSTFPERAKRDGWPAVYASAAAHAFSGWVEVLISVGVFGVGLLHYLNTFSNSTGWTYLSNLPSSTIWDWRGVGLIGALSYLLTPLAWVSLYCIVEGVLRALDAVFSERMLGVALVALPWRAVVALRRLSARRRLEERLGPERPDEVVNGEPGSPVALAIFAAREKPWSERQVLEYGDDFYTVVRRQIVPRGPHHAYRYELHHLEPGEVIRGVLVRYAPQRETVPHGCGEGVGLQGLPAEGAEEASPGVADPARPPGVER